MFKALKFQFPWRKNKKGIKKIVLGICAMDKKAKSKPMREILKRLPEDLFEIIYFGDNCILNEPIENWPLCEVLIAFYSYHFPTQKAIAYVNHRRPFLINDLEMESTLKDRRKVYDLLESLGIDVPNHIFVSRSEENDPNVLEEFDEVSILSVIIMILLKQKVFV